jgi:8-oxo-dGTP diphosphatase
MNVRCIIKNKDKNKVLLCHLKKPDFFFLPGGSIEFQEISTDAIYRELKEEMGLEKSQIKILNFRAVVENIFENCHGVDLVYNVDLVDQDVVSREDHIEFIWYDIKKLDSVDIRPCIMKSLIRKIKGFHFISCNK